MNPMYFAGYYSIITTIQNDGESAGTEEASYGGESTGTEKASYGGESVGAEEAFYGEPVFTEEAGVRDGEVRNDSGEPVVIEEQEPSPV